MISRTSLAAKRCVAVGMGLGSLLLVTAVATEAVAADPPAADPPGVEILIVGGAAWPRGDLAADFQEQQLGFQASGGYTVGFQFRWFLSRDVCVSPGFSFTDFGNYEVDDPEFGVFSVETAVIRYMLGLQWIHGRGRRGLRPLLSVSAGFCRNRYGVAIESPLEEYSESVNALGIDLGAGLRLGTFELLVVYEINRFTTYRFLVVDDRTRYNWDSIQVLLAWAFPTG